MLSISTKNIPSFSGNVSDTLPLPDTQTGAVLFRTPMSLPNRAPDCSDVIISLPSLARTVYRDVISSDNAGPTPEHVQSGCHSNHLVDTGDGPYFINRGHDGTLQVIKRLRHAIWASVNLDDCPHFSRYANCLTSWHCIVGAVPSHRNLPSASKAGGR